MLQSMTGFGKAQATYNQKTISVEIKTLNSKQADISVRCPSLYKSREIEMRNILQTALGRGKIELSISTDTTSDTTPYPINKAAIASYIDQLRQITNAHDLIVDETRLLEMVIRFPEVLRADTTDTLDEAEWAVLISAINDALLSLNEFRNQEGQALATDILKRVNLIEQQLEAITPFEESRIETVRKRIETAFANTEQSDKVDKDRFEQELIYYLEKLDITEEKVRLSNHTKYFAQTIAQDDDQKGRKLGFISQEMGREINTIGSKANHSGIQQIVVQMKDELEKIKEQLMNIL